MNDFSQTIQLPHSIIIQEAVVKSTFKILEVSDNFNNKTVNAKVAIGSDNAHIINITVWDENDYDQIGDWTTSQINSKITEIITNLYTASN
jgi:hypothetical protein